MEGMYVSVKKLNVKKYDVKKTAKKVKRIEKEVKIIDKKIKNKINREAKTEKKLKQSKKRLTGETKRLRDERNKADKRTKILSKKILKIAKKEKELMLKEKKLMKKIKRLTKRAQKAEKKIISKNEAITEIAKEKTTKENELEELKIKLKDLDFLVKEKDNEIELLKKTRGFGTEGQIKKLEKDSLYFKDKIEELKKEIAKKEAIIELFQKPELEYRGIVALDVSNVKVRWLGWSEGGILDEIDYSIVNNSTDPLHDISIDVHVIGKDGRGFKVDGLKTKTTLNPKERSSKKIHLFKHIHKRGEYKIMLKAYLPGQDKEVAEVSRLIRI